MKKQHISAGADKSFASESNENAVFKLPSAAKLYSKNLSKKLEATDIFRKFAEDFGKVTSITLPFDLRKSRKFTRISQWSESDAHTLYYYRAWAAPAVLLIRVVREPTWAT